MFPVLLDSTTLTSAVYIPASAILELEFRGGENYRYFDVPPHLFTELLAAASKGLYFNRNIRNRFRFQHVRLPAELHTIS